MMASLEHATRMHRTDDQLVTAYLDAADEQAFAVLVGRHQERIFGYLMGMVQDRDVANDLFQETFLRAINAMHARRGSYAAQGRWLHWIMRIARNAALDHFRSRKRMRVLEPDPDGVSMMDQVPDDQPGVEESLFRTERTAWLEAYIARLSPEQREVLLLRQDAELTFREIAEMTDCSINTALGRMRYALMNLRRMIEADRSQISGDGKKKTPPQKVHLTEIQEVI